MERETLGVKKRWREIKGKTDVKREKRRERKRDVERLPFPQPSPDKPGSWHEHNDELSLNLGSYQEFAVRSGCCSVNITDQVGVTMTSASPW